MLTAAKKTSLNEALRGISLSVQPGASGKLAETIGEHNSLAAELPGQLDFARDQVEAAVADAAVADPLALDQAIEGRKATEFIVAQSAIRLWAGRRELAVEQAAELNAMVEPAEAKHAEAVVTATALLGEAGLTPSEMIAAGNNSDGARNPAAADLQFAAIARQCQPVRAAYAAADLAKNAAMQATREIATSERGAQNAQAAATSIARKYAAAAM